MLVSSSRVSPVRFAINSEPMNLLNMAQNFLYGGTVYREDNLG
jgi:hypothetical protein